MTSRLPYHDTKPEGAADFYFAIQATFRFILKATGEQGWIRYLQDMAKTYFHPVNEAWRTGGLDEVAAYWKEFFAAEPGAEVEVCREPEAVRIEVKVCPMIRHLRESGRELLPCLCRHCFYLNNARAEEAGLAMRLRGGNGSCTHFYTDLQKAPEQNMADIREAN
jgi:hypothetical protein